jgi:hypothetical protein
MTITLIDEHCVAVSRRGTVAGERCACLRDLTMPMMIDEEKSNIIFCTDNSFYLEQHLPNAQLILYPNAAHGFLFQ